MRNGQLRVEGVSAPGVSVIAESTTSAASARADQNGRFKLEASGLSAPDCFVTLRDGRTPMAILALDGCTPSITPPRRRSSDVVGGAIPTGMTGPNWQGTTAGNITGTPSIAGTYRFTLEVSDQVGATDQETVTITVA